MRFGSDNPSPWNSNLSDGKHRLKACSTAIVLAGFLEAIRTSISLSIGDAPTWQPILVPK